MIREITGKHVLIGLLAFFSLMLAVNGVFVYVATTTFPGVSTDDAYRKGLHYNQTITSFEEQQVAGWNTKAALADGMVRLEVRRQDGSPVNGLDLVSTLGRPTTTAEDRPLEFRRAGEGRYIANAGALEPGQWHLTAEVRPYGAANTVPYKVTARLWAEQ